MLNPEIACRPCPVVEGLEGQVNPRCDGLNMVQCYQNGFEQNSVYQKNVTNEFGTIDY